MLIRAGTMADSGWARFIMDPEPRWILGKGMMTGAIGGLSHSHHPSLASLEGTGMWNRSPELRSELGAERVLGRGAMSAGVQVVFAEIVQGRLFAGTTLAGPLRVKLSRMRDTSRGSSAKWSNETALRC